MTGKHNYMCAALVATKNRRDLLLQRSLPSIIGQSLLPDGIVLVNDGEKFDKNEITAIQKMSGEIPIEILANRRSPGAAGAWNTGLGFLRQMQFDGFVAILDDDDAWDAEHIALNIKKAMETNAEFVISGLRHVITGHVKPRKLPTDLKITDFFCGNPGLQGSNTFVAINALERAGDFTDGLPSLNDRDLAVRLLKTSVRIAYTSQWTATWYHDSARQTLSSPRAMEKILGLQWFWRMYSIEMNNAEREAYLDRAYKCFGVTREEIIGNCGIAQIEEKN